MTEDPFTAYQSRFKAAKSSAVEDLKLSHADLLRQQLSSSSENEDLPALCCLLAANVMGGKTEQILPAATALALLGEMERVFTAIASEGGAGMEAAWGMPRALNAGDAFFNLAQAVLLNASLGLSAERQLQLSASLDKVCRAYADSLYEGRAEAKRKVIGAAMALGALAAGAEETMAGQLAAWAADYDSSRLQTTGLSPEGIEKLKAAGQYLVEVGGL